MIAFDELAGKIEHRYIKTRDLQPAPANFNNVITEISVSPISLDPVTMT